MHVVSVRVTVTNSAPDGGFIEEDTIALLDNPNSTFACIEISDVSEVVGCEGFLFGVEFSVSSRMQELRKLRKFVALGLFKEWAHLRLCPLLS